MKTPAPGRVKAAARARAARRRTKHERWAEEMRQDGWGITTPEEMRRTNQDQEGSNVTQSGLILDTDTGNLRSITTTERWATNDDLPHKPSTENPAHVLDRELRRFLPPAEMAELDRDGYNTADRIEVLAAITQGYHDAADIKPETADGPSGPWYVNSNAEYANPEDVEITICRGIDSRNPNDMITIPGHYETPSEVHAAHIRAQAMCAGLNITSATNGINS